VLSPGVTRNCAPEGARSEPGEAGSMRRIDRTLSNTPVLISG
jgi:hypothetical protein